MGTKGDGQKERSRQDDSGRQELPAKYRPLVREIILEMESRLRQAREEFEQAVATQVATKLETLMTQITEATSTARRANERLDEISPDLKVLLPYIKIKHEVSMKWSKRLDMITDKFILWAVGVVAIFFLFCVYFGATSAMRAIAQPPIAHPSTAQP